MVRLSIHELNVLLYNCLSRHGNKKFKPYVEQFGLLQNMNLAAFGRFKDLYEESAYTAHI